MSPEPSSFLYDSDRNIDLFYRMTNLQRMAAIGKYRKALDRIEDTLSTRLEHSRELLRDLLGEIILRPNDHALEARMRLDW